MLKDHDLNFAIKKPKVSSKFNSPKLVPVLSWENETYLNKKQFSIKISPK